MGSVGEGSKAEGLRLLPPLWTPAYVVVSPSQLQDARPSLRCTAENALKSLSCERVIVRSNAVGETLADRGQFESFIVDTPDAETVADALEKVARAGSDAGTSMGAVIQKYVPHLQKGHLSNERRVSKTRNQWQSEIEEDGALYDRFNSQRDRPADPTKPLPDAHTGMLRRVFASVGRWANETFESRVHIEWVFDGRRIWLVQIDLEDEAPDHGADPLASLDTAGARVFNPPDGSSLLLPADPLRFGEFRKVANIADFAAVCEGLYPPLYVVRGQDLATFVTEEGAAALRTHVGDRLVCRTDLLPPARSSAQGLNLPRTDTVSPDEIVRFMLDKASEFAGRGISSTDYIFIIHQFLPARSGVWAEASPGDRWVRVDALWGLPDGLQTLAHDSFEFDLETNSVVAEHIAFKPMFVAEQPDGSWELRQVKRKQTRHAVLERTSVGAIARGTAELAVKQKAPLRVMWFGGVPGRSEDASALPWFCMKPEEADPTAPRFDRSIVRQLPRRFVRNKSDFARSLGRRHCLVLEPSIEHIRDTVFLEDLAYYAVRGNHIIELRGSILSHAYYLLSKQGAPVVTPDQMRHKRVRRRQTFSKLVRDRIPERIRSKGERVRALKLPEEEHRLALLAKVLEEAQEIAASTAPDDLREELADLLEVLRSLVRNADLTWESVEAEADRKAALVGSFNDGLVLVETTLPTTEADAEILEGKLANISRTTAIERGVLIPFMALLEDAVEINIDARSFRVSLTEDQVRIEDAGPAVLAGQLSLDL